MKSEHNGHRKRLKDRFLEQGLDSFQPHEVLELLLFYSISRSNTNAAGHKLIESFGSLSGVFDAPITELLKVEGVGDRSAALIKLIPDLCRRYMLSAGDATVISNTEQAADHLNRIYIGRREEMVYLLCLDTKCKLLATVHIFTGSVNSAQVSIRKIIENIIKFNATSVIISHNHPGGSALPSYEDLMTTYKVFDSLAGMGVELVDHIICADGDAVSLRDSGYFEKSKRAAVERC